MSGRPCLATNKRKEPCGNLAKEGADWCDVPGHERAVREGRAALAGAMATAAGAPPSPPPLPFPGSPPPPPGGGPEIQEIPADLFAIPVAPPLEAEPIAGAIEEPEGLELGALAGGIVGAVADEEWTDAEVGDVIGDTLDVGFEHYGKRRLSKAARQRLGKAWGPVFRMYLPKVNPDNPLPGALFHTGLEVVPRFGGELVGAVTSRFGGRQAAPAPDDPAPTTPTRPAATVDGVAVPVELGTMPPGSTPRPPYAAR